MSASKKWPWAVAVPPQMSRTEPLRIAARGWPRAGIVRTWAPHMAVVSEDVCVSRAGVYRAEHSLDKDARCVFCDWLQPEGAA